MYTKINGWNFKKQQDICSLKELHHHPPPRMCINYKKKMVTLQWDSLADTTCINFLGLL